MKLILVAFLMMGNFITSGFAQEEALSPVIPEISAPEEVRPLSSPPPELISETFKPQFIRIQMMAERVRELMGSAPGQVIANEKVGELDVSAPADVMTRVRELIKRLDQFREIVFDVKVVQVDLNDEHPLGINWSAIVTDYQNFSSSDGSYQRRLSAGTVLAEDVPVLIEALETVGEIKVYPLTSARILPAQEADLRLKAFDRDAHVVLRTLIPGQEENLLEEDQDRYSARVVMALSPNGEQAVDLEIITAEEKPVKLHIKNDSVGIVGGIITQTKTESTRKFPFLGDVPVLGLVFREQSLVLQRIENIMILTPRIAER